jgi:hypothetical protein
MRTPQKKKGQNANSVETDDVQTDEQQQPQQNHSQLFPLSEKQLSFHNGEYDQ